MRRRQFQVEGKYDLLYFKYIVSANLILGNFSQATRRNKKYFKNESDIIIK